MPRRALQRYDYTVAWICALPVELAAARLMLDEEHERLPEDDTNIYTLGRILEHNVVIYSLPAGRMGTDSAAAVAVQIFDRFPRIQCGLMVGISGGVPSKEADIRLGDVVVSQPQKGHGGVIQYDFGKTKPDGFERTGYLNAPPTLLLDVIASLQAASLISENELEARLTSFRNIPQFTRENAGPDVLFQPTYHHIAGSTCENCETCYLVQRPQREGSQVKVHYGTIASGNQVMRDGLHRDTLSSALGGVLCFEMEAAGLMNRLPCLVVRGICDYADSHKNKKWQPFAAATAAAYAKDVLSLLPPARAIPTLLDSYESRTDQATMKILQKNCQLVLESLAFPEMHRREHVIGAPCPETADWLMQSSEYIGWTRGESRFLWLKGKAGTGKSTVMKHTLKNIRNHASADDFTVATFFYDASGAELEKSTGGFMRTILHDIFMQNPALLEQFVLATEGQGFIKGANLEWHNEELKEVLRILAGLKKWGPTIILIDALDEGSRDETRSLLSLLEDLFPLGEQEPFIKLRVLFSSRHYPNIVLNNCPELWAEKKNRTDIKTFAHRRLSPVSGNSDTEALVKSVLDQGDGVFLWVDLVTKAILAAGEDGKTSMEKLRILKHTPHELEGLYTQIFSKLSETERVETFQIFKWMLFACRRLRPQELCFALQFEATGSISTYNSWKESGYFVAQGVQMDRFIRNRSRGLLEVRSVHEPSENSDSSSDTIQFIHQTVPEFLRRKGLNLLLPQDSIHDMSDYIHYQIAATCTRYLARSEIVTCPSVTVLRCTIRRRGQSFLEWIKPYPTDYDASRARETLYSQYGSNLDVTFFRDRHNIRLVELSASELRRIVQFDLPLLDYAIEALQVHLCQVKPYSSSQSRLFDSLLSFSTWVLPLWYSFQDAWYLPRRHPFHSVDWRGFVQSAAALGLDSCVLELKQRVLARTISAVSSKELAKSLSIAVSLGSLGVVRDLIECGGDPNLRSEDHYCLLDDAVQRRNVHMVHALICYGAKAKTANQFGFTPLHHAASVGDADAAMVLIDAGADIDARLQRSGETPLLLTAVNNKANVLKVLLSRGADEHARDTQGRGVLDLAILNSSETVYSYLRPDEPMLPRLRSLEVEIDRAMTASPSPEKQDHMKRIRSSRFGF